MQLTDYLSLKGHIRIRVLDAKTGTELYREEKSNLVCVGARQAVTRLISQQTTPDDYDETKLWAIYAGTGNTAPDVNDTDLDTVVFKKACDQPFSVNLGTGEVEVQMTIESGEGNGYTYQEAGLFSRGDNDDPNAGGISGVLMYARQLHGQIEKTSSISIEYTWRFQILS
jgi:hypothetical protein